MKMDPPSLALQVGTVSSAVDDLLSGYDRLVDNLPNIASKVATMHNGIIS